MRTTARLISVAFLSLGLMAGCATTDDDMADAGMSAAEQAIADAKAANSAAAASGNEWRDTGKLIKQAEDALKAGDEAKAKALADKALAQARSAQAQARAEDQKHQNTLSDADRAALAATAASASRGSAGMAGKVDSYEVEGGDHLWGISGKDQVYADSYQWPLIYKSNRNQIKDADLVYPGQVLDIDQNASDAEINAAIRHARTRGAWSIGEVEQSDLDYLDQ